MDHSVLKSGSEKYRLIRSGQLPVLKPRWVKVFADIWLNRNRTILSILSIAAGVFAVGMVIHSYLYLMRSSDLAFEHANAASGYIGTEQLSEAQIEHIRRLPEISEVEGRRVETVRIALNGNWYKVQLNAIDFDRSCINLVQPTAGASLPPARQMLLDQSALYLADFNVGDYVIIEVASGKRFEMPIAGLVRDMMASPTVNNERVNIYVDMATAEWLGYANSYNRIMFTTARNRSDFAHVQQVTNLVKEELRNDGVIVLGSYVFPEPGTYPGNLVIDVVILLLGTMAVVSLGLGAFLVFNTVSAMISAEKRQIGVMKVLGAQRHDLLGMFLYVVLFYGVCAFLVSIGPAAWAADRFARFVASPTLMDLWLHPFRIPPVVIIIELLLSILIPTAGAFPAIRTCVCRSPHELIGSQGLSDNFGNHLLDRSLGRIHFIPSSWLLCVGAILRSKKRVFLTLSMLVLGGAFFGGVASLKESSDKTLDALTGTYHYDIEVLFERDYRLRETLRIAASIPGVKSAEGWTGVGSALGRAKGREGNNLRIYGLPIGSKLIQPAIINGRWLAADDMNGLVIDSSIMQEYPDLAPGDSLWLNIGGHDQRWTIIGIYKHVGIHLGYIAYANAPYLERQARSTGQIRQIQLVTIQHDPAFQTEVADRATEIFTKHGLDVTASETISTRRLVIARNFNVIIAVLTIMSILLTLVGSLGLVSTISTSVIERSREIGIVRVLGAGPVDLVRIIFGEGISLVLLSWIVASFLAWPAGQLLANLVGQRLLISRMNYTYSVTGILSWLVLALVFAAAASYGPTRYALSLPVRDLLVYE